LNKMVYMPSSIIKSKQSFTVYEKKILAIFISFFTQKTKTLNISNMELFSGYGLHASWLSTHSQSIIEGLKKPVFLTGKEIIFDIAEYKMSCAVLEDGTRVISEAGLVKNLGSTGGKNYRLRDKRDENKDIGPIPMFIASKALEPFIDGVFEPLDLSPIKYTTDGKNELQGYDATIIPKVCEVWLKAREYKTLQTSQLPKAQKAEMIMRSLAKIGITALVDEATGYQYDREKYELQKILDAYSDIESMRN